MIATCLTPHLIETCNERSILQALPPENMPTLNTTSSYPLFVASNRQLPLSYVKCLGAATVAVPD